MKKGCAKAQPFFIGAAAKQQNTTGLPVDE